MAHFAAIAAVGLPVVIYNIPGRSVLNLDPTVLAELADIPNIVGVKQAHEDLDELRAICAAGELAVYAGNDDLLLAVTELGGAGVISVASHLVGSGDGRDLRRRDVRGPRAGPAQSTPACRISMLRCLSLRTRSSSRPRSRCSA